MALTLTFILIASSVTLALTKTADFFHCLKTSWFCLIKLSACGSCHCHCQRDNNTNNKKQHELQHATNISIVIALLVVGATHATPLQLLLLLLRR